MNRLTNNKGVIFVTVLAMMLMFMTFAFTLTYMIKQDIEVAKNSFDILKDFYSAEAGIEYALGDLYNGGGQDGTVSDDQLYANGNQDYYTTMDHMTSTLTSYSTYLPGTYRQIKTVVNYKPVHAAFQAGNDIYVSWPPASGTIDGSVDYGNSVDLDAMTVTGKLPTQPDTNIFIPTPDLTPTGYYGARDYEYSGSPVTWNNGNPPQGDGGTYYPGIHFITGDLTITAPSAFRLDGTIVATGNVTFNVLATSVTLNPSGDNPAVVAGGNVSFSSCGNLNLNGLIYAGGNVAIVTVSGSNVINGAVVAGADIELASITLSVNFAPLLDPPFFDEPTFGIKEWVGHGLMP